MQPNHDTSKLLERVSTKNESLFEYMDKNKKTFDEPNTLEEKINFLMNEMKLLKENYHIIDKNSEEVTIIIGETRFQGAINLVQ